MEELQVIDKCRLYTDNKLDKLKKALESIPIENWSLIVNGSYARKEASTESDLDYFILHANTVRANELEHIQSRVRKIVCDVVGKGPSQGGAFDCFLEVGALTKNIGGVNDSNLNITRRILFLTEGLALNNPVLYGIQRDELIRRYVSDDISDHQLGMFLLNDLIRYYRTVCVDFEYKTFEDGKSWGIRNIKLVFSRKLLYISGVIIAAEMAQRTAADKRQIACDLISLPPIDRLKKVCRGFIDRALEDYSLFLNALANVELRKGLESVTADRSTHNEEFKRLKNLSHHFSFHLMSALKATYPESHPIYRALIM